MQKLTTAELFNHIEINDYVVEPLPKEIDKRGYIYIVVDKVFPDFIKIGRTINLKKRLVAYNSDKPYPTTIPHYVSNLFKDAHFVESKILEYLYSQTSPTTFSKEWFKKDTLPLCIELVKEAEDFFK